MVQVAPPGAAGRAGAQVKAGEAYQGKLDAPTSICALASPDYPRVPDAPGVALGQVRLKVSVRLSICSFLL